MNFEKYFLHPKFEGKAIMQKLKLLIPSGRGDNLKIIRVSQK